MSLLRDMVADYQLELKECEDEIERLEDRISTWRNRMIEIEEILEQLTRK